MAIGRCPHCNKAPYPYRDEVTKKLIWKNILHIDWLMLIIVIMLIFSAWAYSEDTKTCRAIVADPCKYVDVSICDRGMIDGLEEVYTPVIDEEISRQVQLV